jgi:hypothetical protein
VREPNIAPFYVCAYAGLAETARKHGYALAIHGSVITDMDLVAIPWTDEASDAQTVMRAIKDHLSALTFRECVKSDLPSITEENLDELIAGTKEGRLKNGEEQKPHGRLAWNLYLDHGVKIDLSVMPRVLQA